MNYKYHIEFEIPPINNISQQHNTCNILLSGEIPLTTPYSTVTHFSPYFRTFINLPRKPRGYKSSPNVCCVLGVKGRDTRRGHFPHPSKNQTLCPSSFFFLFWRCAIVVVQMCVVESSHNTKKGEVVGRNKKGRHSTARYTHIISTFLRPKHLRIIRVSLR